MMEKFDTFAALIYVTDTEHAAVMRMFDWKEIRKEGDEQIYYKAEITRGDRQLTVIAAKQDEMGMCAAATLSTKLITHFKPGYLIMPGIAAGTESKENVQMYGDVLVAESVWNYSNGKYVDPLNADIRFGNVGFIPRPTMILMEPDVMEAVKKAFKDPENECYTHLGSLASGSAVVANSEFVDLQIRSQFQSTVGLEMEAYGVAYAAKHAVMPRPYAVIAKSICDFADSRKDDNYQKFAAYTSCEFVKFLLVKTLPEREQA